MSRLCGLRGLSTAATGFAAHHPRFIASAKMAWSSPQEVADALDRLPFVTLRSDERLRRG